MFFSDFDFFLKIFLRCEIFVSFRKCGARTIVCMMYVVVIPIAALTIFIAKHENYVRLNIRIM